MIARPRLDHPGASSKRLCRAFRRGKANGSIRDDRNLGGDVAHFYRLIVVVLLCLCANSYALVPVNGVQYISDINLNDGAVQPKVWRYSKEEACTDGIARYMQTNGGTFTFSRISFNECVAKVPSGAETSIGRWVQRTGVCPANSTAVSGGCQCTSPYVENASQTACEMPPDSCASLKGAMYGETEWASVTKGANYACLGGSGGNAMCQTVAVCDYTSQAPGQAGYTCRGIAYATGTRSSTCTGTGETPTSPSPAPIVDPVNPDKPPVQGQPAPARCPVGQAPGTINGSRACMPTGGDTQTSTPAPGTGTTTTTNSDGSSTTSTTTGRTTCLQGSCTTSTSTTTTTTNGSGNNTCPAGQTSGTTIVGAETRTTCTGTATGSSTGSQSGFCEKNPKDKQCDGDGSDTSFGGTCVGGFKAVSDDAVLNAMAEEQYKRNCEFFEKKPDATDETRAYDAMLAKGKQGGDQTGDLPEGSKRDYTIGPGDFDYTSAIGPQQCFTDRSVTMWGKSITIPLSVVCPWLEILGNILVVVGSLLAARIVVRG